MNKYEVFENNSNLISSDKLNKQLKSIKNKIDEILDITKVIEQPEVESNVRNDILNIVDRIDDISLSLRKLIQEMGEKHFENVTTSTNIDTQLEMSKITDLCLKNIKQHVEYKDNELVITIPLLFKTHRKERNYRYNYTYAEIIKALMIKYAQVNNIEWETMFKAPVKMCIERHLIEDDRMPDLTNLSAQAIIDFIYSQLNLSDGYKSLIELTYKTFIVENENDTKTVIKIKNTQ